MARRISPVALHLVFTAAWALAIVPTLLWWRQSILWIAFMSLWANVASHWASYEAAKAARKIDEVTPPEETR